MVHKWLFGLMSISLLGAPTVFAECPPPYAFSWSWVSMHPFSMAPLDVAVDSAGDVYVIDSDNNRILHFKRDGQLLEQIRYDGFISPQSLAIDRDGTLYLVQPLFYKVRRLGPSGWIRSIEGIGEAVAVGPDGRVYVLSLHPHEVLVWSPDGTLLDHWGEFQNPSDIAVSPGNEVFVSDVGRVRHYASDGTHLADWETVYPFVPTSIAIGEDGTVVVSSTAGIYTYNEHGQLLCSWGSYGEGPGQFESISSISLNADGDLYVAERYEHRMHMYGMRLPSDDPPSPTMTAGHDAGILLHLASSSRNSCRAPLSLEEIVTSGEVDPAGTRYLVYLLVTPDTRRGIDNAGVGGIQLGISYSDSTTGQRGVSVLDWRSCATLEFKDARWPATKSGNTITWGTSELCERTDVAVAGVFDVAVYGTSMMSVAPWPVTGEVKFADCGAAEGRVLALNRVGWISLGGAQVHGDADGCNPVLSPCQGPTPVLDTTWGRIKTRYR